MKAVIDGATLHKYEKESSKLRMAGGSWTINLDQVKTDKIKTVVYETKYAVYRIDFDEAQRKGFSRMFQGELKLVVPTKFWQITKK